MADLVVSMELRFAVAFASGPSTTSPPERLTLERVTTRELSSTKAPRVEADCTPLGSTKLFCRLVAV